jgi:hypothetical protein
MMDVDDNDELPPPKVTDAPAAIWLVYGDIERDCTHWECARNGDVGWCEDKQFDSDVEYVRADTIEAQAERIRVLREALLVAQTALAEVAHAQSAGANWYTRGASGLYQQVAMWVRKGREAINAALEATND